MKHGFGSVLHMLGRVELIDVGHIGNFLKTQHCCLAIIRQLVTCDFKTGEFLRCKFWGSSNIFLSSMLLCLSSHYWCQNLWWMEEKRFIGMFSCHTRQDIQKWMLEIFINKTWVVSTAGQAKSIMIKGPLHTGNLH